MGKEVNQILCRHSDAAHPVSSVNAPLAQAKLLQEGAGTKLCHGCCQIG